LDRLWPRFEHHAADGLLGVNGDLCLGIAREEDRLETLRADHRDLVA
jgi:hypothetical protein